ncbi:MAG: DUF1905 domain-containing protein [Actinomycetota bacterium]
MACSPFHFLTIPEKQSVKIKEISKIVTYGWGVIPVSAKIGRTTWTTSLFPKDGLYLLPIKNAVRTSENIELGDKIRAEITIEMDLQ